MTRFVGRVAQRAELEQDLAHQRAVAAERAELLELAPVGIFVRDLCDSSIRYWSRGATDLYGWRPEQAIGQVSHALLKTQFPEPLEAIEATLLRIGRWEGELLHTTRDGQQLVVASRWALERGHQGEPAAILEINTDLTATQQAEAVRAELAAEQAARLATEAHRQHLADVLAALQEREERFRAIFEQSAVGIAQVALDGRWLRVNERLCQLLGYSREELHLRTFQDLTHPDDLHADLAQVQRLLAGDITSYQLDKRYRRKDGSLLWATLTVSLLREVTGEPKYFISVVQDSTERKQAEQALRESEQRYRGMVETAQEGVWLIDGDNRTTFVNARMAAMLGYTVQEMLGRPVSDFVQEDEQERSAASLKQRAQGRVGQVEFRLRRKDGRQLWALMANSPLFDATGQYAGALTMVTDITARKQGEQALQDSLERFETLADNISQLAWMADAQGWIFWYNRRWLEYTGTTLEQMQGWGWTRVHHPDHVERVVARIQHAWATGEPWEDTFPLRGKDGQYRWFLSRAVPIRDASGAIVRWFGTNTDVTELRQAQQAQQLLAEASQAFATASLNKHALLDGIAQHVGQALGDTCVVWLRVGDGPLLEPAAIYHADPAVAKLIQTLLAQAPARLDEGIMAEVARTGQAVCVPDISLQEQRRRVKPAYWSFLERVGASSLALAPLRVGGQVLGTLGISRDQSGRPSTDADLRLLQDLADRAALALEVGRRFEQALTAVRARDDVLAAVSHDLKTPLTGIAGSAQLLEQQLVRAGQGDERMVRTVDRIMGGCRRMASMMDELVDAARLEAGQTLVLHRAATELVALVRAALADQEVVASNHALRISAMPDQLIGVWDAARLRRVLDNVLSNALKYSPQGGAVDVEVAVEEEANARWAVVRIADQGLGIPAADLPHIFERFRRGRNVAGIAGTGLGLSGAKQIVEQHGGQLTVDSQEGVGSTFTVRLPLPGEHNAA